MLTEKHWQLWGIRKQKSSQMLDKYANLLNLTPTGLSYKINPTIEQWLDVQSSLSRVETGIQWWLGDNYKIGQGLFGEKASQSLPISDKTWLNYSYVANKIDPSRRRESLTFSHHAELAALPQDKFEEIADKIESDNLSVRETRDVIKNIRNNKIIEPQYCSNCELKFTYWLYCFRKLNIQICEDCFKEASVVRSLKLRG